MKRIMLIGIICLFVLAGCQGEPEDTTNTTSTTPNTTTTSNISLSDFKECRKAESWQEYFNTTDRGHSPKRFIETTFKNTSLHTISPIAPPLKKNLADAKIYSIPFGKAGGDILTRAFLRIDELYCPFTLENAQVLFRPINSASEALNYTTFLTITLAGSEYGRDHRVIRKKEAYDDLHCPNVNTSNLSPKERTITNVEAGEEGFIVDLITFTRSGNMGLHQTKIEVSRKGEMSNAQMGALGDTKQILDCGRGMMY